MLIPQVTVAGYNLPYTKDGELYGDIHIAQFFRPYKTQMYEHNTEHLKKFKESSNPVGIYQYYKNNDGCTLVTWSVDYDFPPTFYILKDNDSETRGFLLYTIDNQVMFRAVEEHTEFATTVRINDKGFVFPPSDKWYTRTTLKTEGGTEREKKDCSVLFKVNKGIGQEFPQQREEAALISLDIWNRYSDSVITEHEIYTYGLLSHRWARVSRRYRNTSIPTVTHYNSGGYSPTESVKVRDMFRYRFIDNYYSDSGELVCRTSGYIEEMLGVPEIVKNVKEFFDDFVSEFSDTKRKTELSPDFDYVQLGLQKMPTPGIIVNDGDNKTTTVSKDTFTRYTDSGAFANTPKPKQLFLFDRKLEPIKVTMTNGAKETVDFSPVKKLVITSE